MKQLIAAVAVLAATAPAAWAQSSVTLDARAGPPIVQAVINDRPVRLEVDLRMFDALAVSNAAADRLRLRRVPALAVRIGVEGSDATIRGRVARPRFSIAGEAARAFAGIFPAPVTNRADGVIGPGALPHDVIIVQLGEERPGSRDIVFSLEDPDIWGSSATIGGETLRVYFSLAREASVFNRPASRLFDGAGAIVADGALVEQPVALGLSTLMQPVTTTLSLDGFALSPALARTNAPLLGATEADAIVVTASSDAPAPSVTLGRAALAPCAWMRADRRARTLTVRCAP